MTTTAPNGLREGSAEKRAAILAAARELFLAQGFERASMDAVAARAGVSKRTVYDYFGDKRTLFLTVVDQVVQVLSTTIETAIAEHLTEVADIEQALVGLASGVTLSAIGSSDYAELMRLLATESGTLGDLHAEHWSAAEPEDVLAERFAVLHRQGLLDAPDSRLAADHFVALTLKPPATGHGLAANPETDDRWITDAVRAFLRAYGPGRNPSASPAA